MSLQNKKTLKVYEKVAKNYLENTIKANSLYKEGAKNAKKELESLIKNTFRELPSESKILEVGSANGEISKYIKKLGFSVTASDIAEDFLNAIRDNGLEPIKFNLLTDDFTSKYDGIVCWRVFVHFTKEDTLKALTKSYSALNNNGIFIFNVIDRNCKTIDNEWIDFPDIYHVGEERFFNYYSKESMDSIIEKTKFEIIDYHEILGENGVKWLVYVLKKQINSELKKYIEENVFPEYEKNEVGHGINHINYVIERSFELINENNLDVDLNMVYVIASYHDIGHHIDSKRHEIVSAEIMSKDQSLNKFFNKKELKIIKEAIEDHRASSDKDPRTIYGKIVSSADRNNTIKDCLERTYTYGHRLNPDLTDEELFERAHDVLLRKFGDNGYAKFYFKDKKYEDFLKDIRKLLSNKDKYIKIQRDYINKLKKENKI